MANKKQTDNTMNDLHEMIKQSEWPENTQEWAEDIVDMFVDVVVKEIKKAGSTNPDEIISIIQSLKKE